MVASDSFFGAAGLRAAVFFAVEAVFFAGLAGFLAKVFSLNP
jgi:hypothetical protein